MNEYLTDRAFLNWLDSQTQLTQYVRLNILDNNDRYIQSINGLATGGSININGSSAVRRTLSLTMIAIPEDMIGYEDQANTHITKLRNLIAMNKRASVDIGLKNPGGYSQYADVDIFWFPQGHYVITAANVSENAQGLSLSANLKDKMCLLNGECGGTLTEPITHSPFYQETFDDNGVATFTKTYAKYRDIIYELLTEFGGIPEDKIIVSDIENRIRNAVRWTGQGDLYIKGGGVDQSYSLSTIPVENPDWIAKFNDSIGYQNVDFTYPTDKELTSNPNETIVSVLDKLKNSLGNFEYFFDIDGVFHFQEIKNFLNQGSAVNDLATAIGEKYFINTGEAKSQYSFTNKNIITAYTNNPQYLKIKNDIMVRGKKDRLPIRYHLVLDDVSIPADKEWQVVYYKRMTNTDASKPIYEKGIDGQEVWRARLATSEDVNPTSVKSIELTDYRDYLYFASLENDLLSPFSKEVKEEWPKIYNVQSHEWRVKTDNLGAIEWFIDFVNPNLYYSKESFPYLVSAVGRRPTVMSDDTINCVFAPKFPDYTLIELGTDTTEAERAEAIAKGQAFIQVPQAIMQNLGLGMATNPAYDAIRAAVHAYMSYNESITLQCVPIYHLEPNIRISVKNEDIDIDGDYLINSLTIPLAASGTMSINAVRAVERV